MKKLIFKYMLLSLLSLPVALHAENYIKKVRQGFPRSQITALNITNKFGTVEISDTGGDSVTVDARITAKDMSQSRANELLKLIRINIRKNGATVVAETVISENFKTKGNFTIDYRINIPKDRDLTVNNKFGNVVLQDLTGKGNFTIGYGNLTAGNLNSPAGSPFWLELSYGKADIGSLNRMKGLVKYSKVFVGTAGSIETDSKYSGLDVKKMTELKLESRYDGIRIGEVGSLSANSKYTNYNIGKLNKTLVMDTEYGSVRIDEVNPGFSGIEIINSYGGVTIGLNQADYLLDAQCDYCDIKYPGDRFQGNRARENHSFRLQGKVGSGSGQKVTIRSRYGGINLGN